MSFPSTLHRIGDYPVDRLVVYFVLFPMVWCSFFPYLTIVHTGTDTQPFALLFAIIAACIFLPSIRLPSTLWAGAALLLAATILVLADGLSNTVLRSYLGYLTLFLVSVGFYIALCRDWVLLRKWMDYAILAWLIVGLIQYFGDRSFLGFLISDMRTTASRGVTSLAPEPTYFGSMMLFFLLARIPLGGSKVSMFMAAGAILFPAMSSQVLAVFFVASGAALMMLLMERSYRIYAVIGFVAAVIAVVLFANFAEGTRPYLLVDMALDDPLALYQLDASVNQRVGHILASFLSIYELKLVPQGLSGFTWLDYLDKLALEYPRAINSRIVTDRNLSGLGRIVFELGPLVLIFIYQVARPLMGMNASLGMKIFMGMAFLLLVTTAIPLAHPMIAVVLATWTFAWVQRDVIAQASPSRR